jgi:hypothetical protein
VDGRIERSHSSSKPSRRWDPFVTIDPATGTALRISIAQRWIETLDGAYRWNLSLDGDIVRTLEAAARKVAEWQRSRR